MKVVITGANGPEALQRPEADPAAGEVAIRVRAALVTGLERAAATGFGGFEGVPGHAGVGTVEAIGPEVDGSWVGQRVVPRPIGWCGRCDRCRAGLRDHCEERTVLGLEGRDGCLAERVIVPASTITAVPDGLDDEMAVFAPLVGSALQLRRQVTFEGKPYVTVLGDGVLGLLAAQVLAPMNASVRVIGRHTEKMARCERWGVKHRHVDDIGRRQDQDVVVECTGRPEGLELAARLVRPRGTIVLKSVLGEHAELAVAPDLRPLVTGEIQVVGSFLGPVDEALAMLARGALEVTGLIDRRARLDDAADLLRAGRRPGSLATLVTTAG